MNTRQSTRNEPLGVSNTRQRGLRSMFVRCAYLLAEAGFNGHRIRIEPLLLGHVRAVICIHEDVEHGRLVHQW